MVTLAVHGYWRGLVMHSCVRRLSKMKLLTLLNPAASRVRFKTPIRAISFRHWSCPSLLSIQHSSLMTMNQLMVTSSCECRYATGPYTVASLRNLGPTCPMLQDKCSANWLPCYKAHPYSLHGSKTNFLLNTNLNSVL